MRMVVIAAGLAGIGVGGFVMRVVVGMRVVAQMLAMLHSAFHDIADASRRREGGIERDGECQQEGEEKAHGAHYIRQASPSRPRRLLQLQLQAETGDG